MIASEGRDWLRARWLPSHVPDSVFLAYFVAGCVFAVLAPMTQNVLVVWPIKKLSFTLTSVVLGPKLLEAWDTNKQQTKNCSQKAVVRKSSCECVRV